MRKAILIAIMLIAPNAWCGDEEDEKEEPKGPSIEEIMEKDAVLERNVKRIVTRMEREDEELEEAKRKHKEAITELKEDLAETYERRMKHYTRKGDIRTATALMEMADKIKANKVDKPIEPEKTRDNVVIDLKCEIKTLKRNTFVFSNRNYSFSVVNPPLNGLDFTVFPVGVNSEYTIKSNKTQTIYLLTDARDNLNLDGWKKENILIKANLPNTSIVVLSKKFKKEDVFVVPKTPIIAPIVATKDIAKN